MDNIVLFLTIIMAGVAGLLFFVSLVSWYRIRSIKLAIVGLAFIVFFLKALLLLLNLIVQDVTAVIIDSVILILLYFAVIKK